MIKFEEHDGMLFKMLDEPTPLTPDAEVPCLVRFRMPFLERFRGKHEEMAYFCDAIKKSQLYGNRLYAYDTRRVGCIAEPRELEIIGYPVADGSAEWRNYQLVQGKCVYHPGDSEYYQASGQGRIIGKIIENNEFNSTWNSDTFMRDDSDGWQLYEPKPEPPKEPDYVICKRCGGSQSIPNPDVSNTACATCPKCGGTGYEIKQLKQTGIIIFGFFSKAVIIILY